MKRHGKIVGMVGILCAFAGQFCTGQSRAQARPLVNVDAEGVGTHGYDPVAFVYPK